MGGAFWEYGLYPLKVIMNINDLVWEGGAEFLHILLKSQEILLLL
jgi:hypothetical protein